jgi:hypothetical protein
LTLNVLRHPINAPYHDQGTSPIKRTHVVSIEGHDILTDSSNNERVEVFCVGADLLVEMH